MTNDLPQPDAAWRRNFRYRLLAWFARHKRDLPWRNSRDPYAIWVSEIMLQQTQVATVVPYFERFMAALPTIESLARASEQRVLRLWEGLGYYRRARQLHLAARRVVDEHAGCFPTTVDQVRALPGIGRYTAGAILSMAYDKRLPVLEANTQRLYCRLLAYRDDPTRQPGQACLWEFADSLLPRRRVGHFNQALMELGSQVCRPRDPGCERCPVTSLCAARRCNAQAEIPLRRRRPRIEEVREICAVVWRGDEVLIRRCGPGERWAGMWDFPRFPCSARHKAGTDDELVRQTRFLTGVTITPGPLLTTLRHGVTRFRITLDCHECRYDSGSLRDGELRWIRPARLVSTPLSATGRRIAQLLSRGARPADAEKP